MIQKSDCLHTLYEEWLEYKQTVTNSPNTIKRHEQHYRKYFEPSVLHEKKLKQLDELLLEKECNRIVKGYNLSRKEWGNIKTILHGMLHSFVCMEVRFREAIMEYILAVILVWSFSEAALPVIQSE